MIRAVRGIDRRPISDEAFEKFARINAIAQGLCEARTGMGLRTILLADLGKNVLAYWLAAEACGLRVAAVADDNLGGRGWSYRGVPLMTHEAARTIRFDAVVISNLSPIHAALRRDFWRRAQRKPVIDLFENEVGGVETAEAFAPSLHHPVTPSLFTSAAAPAASGSRRTVAHIA